MQLHIQKPDHIFLYVFQNCQHFQIVRRMIAYKKLYFQNSQQTGKISFVRQEIFLSEVYLSKAS